MGTQINIKEETRPNNWLSMLARDESSPQYTSQLGEDRILNKVFEVIGVRHKWCVEFGAADGKRGSNTWQFINRQGWSGVQIEPKKDKDLLLKQKRDTYEALVERYGKNDRVQCLDVMVGYEGKSKLDNILDKTATPTDFDLLSIDIDSEDYRVWQALEKFRPRVVVVEHNKTVPIEIAFASDQGSSLRALYDLAKSKGYELVAATIVNGIFVAKEESKKFAIENNDPAEIWTDHERFRNLLWQTYTGEVIVSGNNKLRWVRGEDATLEGQMKAGKISWYAGEDFYSSKRGEVQAKSWFTGKLRHWLYKIADKL